MKFSIKILMASATMFSFTWANAQIKNAKTETIKVYGNCDMCEKNIEKAGDVKNVAEVEWNHFSKMATITYDSKLTTEDAVLKRIALAGYDNAKYLAPDDVYANLHSCCKYERKLKPDFAENKQKEAVAEAAEKEALMVETVSPMQAVLSEYFLLKDALVKSDASTAAANAAKLAAAVKAVKMDKLSSDVHMVWMNENENIYNQSSAIAKSNDLKAQRSAFAKLSKSLYIIVKTVNPKEVVYYQYCPMKKANWLSKEEKIENPYYGSMMLSCGSVVETIK